MTNQNSREPRPDNAVKIGLVGGYGHASVASLPGAILAWAADGFDEAAWQQAEHRACPRKYGDLDAMLEEFDPDIVYIGSAYALNGQLSARALERGYDVISEKPLAGEWAILEKLRALTASGERRLIAEFTMRWDPSFKRVRDVVRSGQIGEPLMVQAQKTYKFGTARPDFYKNRQLFGGIIPWVAIHAIDFVSWCTGLGYTKVSASYAPSRFDGFPDLETCAAMFFEMDGGIPCVISADFWRPTEAATHADDRLRVTGTKGVIEISEKEVILISPEKEFRWSRHADVFSTRLCAEALVAAAQGRADEISTSECLSVTAAALAARDAADSGQLRPLSATMMAESSRVSTG